MSLTPDEKEGLKNLERLTRAIDRAYHHPGPLIWRGFLIGIASGLGATIGVAIILALFGFLLRELGGMPFIGAWLQGLDSSLQRF